VNPELGEDDLKELRPEMHCEEQVVSSLVSETWSAYSVEDSFLKSWSMGSQMSANILSLLEEVGVFWYKSIFES
jgi:hypothetical protein